MEARSTARKGLIVRRNYFFCRGTPCAFRPQIYLDNGGHRPGTSTGQEWWLITLHYITCRRSCLLLSLFLSRISLSLSPPPSTAASGTPAPSCNNFIYLLNPATYVSRMINGGAKEILAPPRSLGNIPSNEMTGGKGGGRRGPPICRPLFHRARPRKSRAKRRDIPAL